ncbi:hypothetical protein [Chitinophaga sp. GbtcB8]|nr:hypothetical protein [Chitinophaga sp. GbtcB8]
MNADTNTKLSTIAPQYWEAASEHKAGANGYQLIANGLAPTAQWCKT